jgi:phosphoribosylformylglycinamidine synthase
MTQLLFIFLSGNVLKELVSPAGAVIRVSEFQLGDPTLSVLEIWGAEYQESNALLIRPEHHSRLQCIASREKCPVSFVGRITGDGKVCHTLLGGCKKLDDQNQRSVS